MAVKKLPPAQIGKCGELLLQYRLLKAGIESAHLTTDTGIDLVAYSPQKKNPLTIQVKTNERPKPGGGKGKLALDWWMPDESPADLVDFIDLSSERIWIFTWAELEKTAQQKSNGRLHFYMYVDDAYTPRRPESHAREFGNYLFENRVGRIFGKAV